MTSSEVQRPHCKRGRGRHSGCGEADSSQPAFAERAVDDRPTDSGDVRATFASCLGGNLASKVQEGGGDAKYRRSLARTGARQARPDDSRISPRIDSSRRARLEPHPVKALGVAVSRRRCWSGTRTGRTGAGRHAWPSQGPRARVAGSALPRLGSAAKGELRHAFLPTVLYIEKDSDCCTCFQSSPR